MPSDEKYEEIFETDSPIEGSGADEDHSEGQVGPRCVIFDSLQILVQLHDARDPV